MDGAPLCWTSCRNLLGAARAAPGKRLSTAGPFLLQATAVGGLGTIESWRGASQRRAAADCGCTQALVRALQPAAHSKPRLASAARARPPRAGKHVKHIERACSASSLAGTWPAQTFQSSSSARSARCNLSRSNPLKCLRLIYLSHMSQSGVDNVALEEQQTTQGGTAHVR